MILDVMKKYCYDSFCNEDLNVGIVFCKEYFLLQQFFCKVNLVIVVKINIILFFSYFLRVMFFFLENWFDFLDMWFCYNYLYLNDSGQVFNNFVSLDLKFRLKLKDCLVAEIYFLVVFD